MGDKPTHPCYYSIISDGVFKNSVVDYKINDAVFKINITD